MARGMSSGTGALPAKTEHDSLEKPDQIHGRIAEHAKLLSGYHDRLCVMEKRMGIKPKVGANFDRDQAGTVKGDPAKHDKEPGAKKDKLESMYARKRHA